MSRILEQPDIEGPAGRAWICKECAEEASQNKTAGLEILLVEQEVGDSEPMHKVLTLSHLRESDLLALPDISKPGATHELRVWEVNPDTENSIDPHDASTLHLLYYPIIEQFIAQNDNAAMQKVAEAVTNLVVQKSIDLKSNKREDWDRLFAEQEAEIIH